MYLHNPFKNINSQDNWILIVERALGLNLKNTRKDCFISCFPFLFLLEIIGLSLKLIKKMIDYQQ